MEELALLAGSMLTRFVKETRATFALPEIAPRVAPPVCLGGARDAQLSPKDPGDTTDDNAQTIDLGKGSSPSTMRAADLSEAAPEPAAVEAVQGEPALLDGDDEETDLRATLPYHSDRCARLSLSSLATPLTPEAAVFAMSPSAQRDGLDASISSLGALSITGSRSLPDGGWSPISMRPPAVARRRALFFKRDLPVALGAMAMAVAFALVRPALLRPGAAVLAAAPLVDVPSLVRHVPGSPPGSGGEAVTPGTIALPADGARTCVRTGASAAPAAEKTTIMRKQSGGPHQWRREAAPLSKLAGPRQYPEEEPVTSPRPRAPKYSPKGI
jgi:hypothetical protein